MWIAEKMEFYCMKKNALQQESENESWSAEFFFIIDCINYQKKKIIFWGLEIY